MLIKKKYVNTSESEGRFIFNFSDFFSRILSQSFETQKVPKQTVEDVFISIKVFLKFHYENGSFD
jgi:hypothetical protein